MRKLLRRVLKSLDRLDADRLHELVRQLVEDNEQLEIVLSSIPGGILVMGPDNRINMINTPAKRLIPFKEGNLMNEFPWDVLASPELALYAKEALEQKRSAMRRNFSVEQRGQQIILNCGILPLVLEGRIRGNFFYAEDVTAQRAEAERLRRAENLASLTTMAAGVAHEIKNPLASMGIHIQLLKRILPMKKGEDVEKFLNILDEEVTRLDSIVADYLFAVRPTNISSGRFSLNELITDLIQFLCYEMEESRVNVVLLLEETLPRIVMDETAMKQALLNIIKNALAAMPSGGELRIQTCREGDQLLLSVKDTGTGIPEELQGKIFEPYYTTKETGSGLGLTVVYKVIREHGGEIQIASNPGRGTNFRIFLPIPQTEQRLLTGDES